MLLNEYQNYGQMSFRNYPCSFTVHITKGPAALGWSHGIELLYTILKNRYLHRHISRRTLGHMSIELNRQGREPLFMGQALGDMLLFKTHILGGMGPHLFLRPHHKERYPEMLEHADMITVVGSLEKREELETEYAESVDKKNLISFATYLVSEEVMDRLEDFYFNYEKHTHESKNLLAPRAGNRYGFGADPLKFEGAGCATLVESFFELAKLKNHYEECCYRHLQIPATIYQKDRKKSFFDLFSLSLLGKNKKHNLLIDIPDPALFHERIHHLVEKNSKSFTKGLIEEKFYGLPILKAEKWQQTKANHLVVDARL